MKKKNHYYIGVVVKDKVKFVTGIDNEKRMAEWVDNKQPKEFCKEYADDIAMGLCCNGYYAFSVKSFYELQFENGQLK